MDGLQYFIGNEHPYPKTMDRNLAVVGAHLVHMLRDTRETFFQELLTSLLKMLKVAAFRLPTSIANLSASGFGNRWKKPNSVSWQERVILTAWMFYAASWLVCGTVRDLNGFSMYSSARNIIYGLLIQSGTI
jgi:hypothetical protein